jgi:hypothetical protein
LHLDPTSQIKPCPKEATVGIRLYPNTENPAVLAKLARVPSGTMRRLNNLKAVKVCTRKGVDYYLIAGVPHLMRRRDFNDMEAIWDAEWQATQAGPDVARLGHFIMDGWGKMGSVPIEAMRVHGPLEVKVNRATSRKVRPACTVEFPCETRRPNSQIELQRNPAGVLRRNPARRGAECCTNRLCHRQASRLRRGLYPSQQAALRLFLPVVLTKQKPARPTCIFNKRFA